MRDYLEGWVDVRDVDIPPVEQKGFAEPVIIREHVEPLASRPPQEPEEDEEAMVLLRREPEMHVFVKRLKTGETKEFTGDEMVLGKGADCEWQIEGNPTVSRHHARIRKTPEGYLLEDMQSLNHTFLGEEQVTGAVRLIKESRFTLSDETFEFIIEIR